LPERSATARWEGGLQDGKGTMRLGSGAFEGQYSFSSRFEEGTGTNPEELIGAAFREQAETAKKNCPVSRALAGVDIQLDARLAA
jgi:organic hydroperoxide reductase OsmC/OhrA